MKTPEQLARRAAKRYTRALRTSLGGVADSYEIMRVGVALLVGAFIGYLIVLPLLIFG